MAYNHGKEERKWRLWKEAEEKILRAYGVDENIIEEIRIYDRAEFNSDRRFYRRLNDMEEYIEKVADNGLNTEIKTVSALLDEVENEHLYAALLKVDKHTLEIVLLKMQGYSTKEISAMLQLTEKAIYKRMDRLRANYAQTECQFRYCGTAIPFLTVRSTAR